MLSDMEREIANDLEEEDDEISDVEDEDYFPNQDDLHSSGESDYETGDEDDGDDSIEALHFLQNQPGDTEQAAFYEDGLQVLATEVGWKLHNIEKFKKHVIFSKKRLPRAPEWASLVKSTGSFQTSDDFFKVIKAMDNIFVQRNGEDVNRTPGILKYLSREAAKYVPNLEKEMAEIFFKLRLRTRISCLNNVPQNFSNKFLTSLAIFNP